MLELGNWSFSGCWMLDVGVFFIAPAMKFRLPSKYIPLIATALVLAALYVLGCVSFPNFGSLRVLVNLVGDNAFLGVAAVGATFVILSGGIDLSVGSLVAFTSILIASLLDHGMNPLL